MQKMNKKTLTGILILISISSSSADDRIRKELRDHPVTTKTKVFQESYNVCKMDVQLTNISDPSLPTNDSHGVVELLLAGVPRPLLVCFPESRGSLGQTILLSHVACRQLGFITVGAVHAISLPRRARWLGADNETAALSPAFEARGVDPDAWTCDGYEQAVGQCAWSHVRAERCDAVLDVECGECQKIITEERNGTIKSPGYPYAYIYNVECRWKIEFPKEFSIFLQLSHHDDTNETTFACESCKPYIKLFYYNINYKHNFNWDWYNSSDSLNQTVPYGKVEIHYFSGLHSSKSAKRPQGFEITYKVYRPVKTQNYSLINVGYVALGVGLFYFVFLIIACIYGCVTVYCKESSTSGQEANCNTSEHQTIDIENSDILPRYEELHGGGRRGLRLRTPHSSDLVKENLFVAVDSTPVEPPPEYDDVVKTVLRPPPDVTDADRSHPVQSVRANLCSRFSRNSTSQSGVLLEDERFRYVTLRENDPRVNQYLQVQAPRGVSTSSPAESSVFLPSDGESPNYFSPGKEFRLDHAIEMQPGIQ